jgi:hypothetical protein|tara:strand:- start:152 stop:499 length:348 start_codon:yes stop_codon:yes gene_type:complete
MKEYQIQIKLVNYLKSKKLSKFRFFHIPNQGIRSIAYKMLLSSMGMKSGCPDLILEFKGGKIVYIEIKTAKGVLSKSQKLWLNTSNSLKTPHYILKGEINDLIIQLNNIINKYYN